MFFGTWKDVGIRLEGETVNQLTSIFLGDYELNVKSPVEDFSLYFTGGFSLPDSGYIVPFGDGPSPLYKHRVAKIMNSVWISSMPVTFALLSSSRINSRLASSGVLFLPIFFSSICLFYYTLYMEFTQDLG